MAAKLGPTDQMLLALANLFVIGMKKSPCSLIKHVMGKEDFDQCCRNALGDGLVTIEEDESTMSINPSALAFFLPSVQVILPVTTSEVQRRLKSICSLSGPTARNL